MVEVELAAVKVDLRSNAPVLLLQEVAAPNRTLPIFIGSPEASSIEYAARGIATPRPLTHDLLRDVIDALGGKIERVVITELRDGTYYAEMEMVRERVPFVVSCRPSDAVAIALRVGSPMFVADELMNAEGIVLEVDEDIETEEPGTQEEIVDEFRDFLNSIRPEDFS